MKSERRHELETNELALWLRWRLPELLEKYGTRILLGVIVLALVVVLIRYRMNAPKQAAAAAADNLALAREYIQQLKVRQRAPGDAAQASKLIGNALDQSDDPTIQAQGYLALGEYYWALANWPDVPAAATQPSLRPELPRAELLTNAEKAYTQALAKASEQGYLAAGARLSLAAVAETRARDLDGKNDPQAERHWAAAKQQYEAVLNLSSAPQVLKDEAKWHLDNLDEIQQPVWLVAATQPTTQPGATQPSTSPAPTDGSAPAPTTGTSISPATRPATVPAQPAS